MTLSRKAFLSRGLISFGRDLVQSVRGEAADEVVRTGPEEFGLLLIDLMRLKSLYMLASLVLVGLASVAVSVILRRRS